MLPDGSLFGEGVKTRLKEHADGGVQPPIPSSACPIQRVQTVCQSIGTNLLFFEKGDADASDIVVLGAPRAGPGQKAYNDDQADPLQEHLARLHRLVGRAEAQGPHVKTDAGMEA